MLQGHLWAQGEKVGSGPVASPPIDDPSNGPTVPGHPIPENREPGGIGFEQEIKLQERPGIVEIHRPGEVQPEGVVEELLDELGDETRHVKSSLDETSGLVRQLRIENKPDNPYVKGQGTPFARANSFLQRYKHLFFSSSRTTKESVLSLISSTDRDEVGMSHLKYKQMVGRIEVAGAELFVHLNDEGIISINGLTLVIPEDLSITPVIRIDQAKFVAQQWAEEEFKNVSVRFSVPRLEIFDIGFYTKRESSEPHLAWHINILSASDIEPIDELVWIDAHNGEVIHHYSNIHHAKNRNIYNCDNTFNCSLERSEGQSSSSEPDVNFAYDYFGNTYDYFYNIHNRDSYDDNGKTILGLVKKCVSGAPCPYSNASWNGYSFSFGAGWAVDDVVAHEFTHAVTDHSANLIYSYQSGALNESFSDIFGEVVDLTNGLGNDSNGVRWLVSEDVPGDPIRNMQNPNQYGNDPGKVSDPLYHTGSSDNGGVHSNSGVPNHAFALMVDGGSYNNFGINGIGISKAAKIQYRTLINYLVTNSQFSDNFAAVNNSCADLTGTNGITSNDCANVCRALLAVEMNTSGGQCNSSIDYTHYDFNSDQKADILWRQIGAGNGDNVLYLMDGYTILANLLINNVPGSLWEIKGVGDFNGDDRSDILWRDFATGDNVLYLMNGSTILANSYINNVPGLFWGIKGVGDFNADTKSDIVWRDAVTGQNALYLMNGSTILANSLINVVTDPNWKIMEVGDYNDDGKSDLLWRNAINGEVWMYLMDGATIISSSHIAYTGLDWEIEGAGDYNGDGNADILWRNTVTGEAWMYLMNGTTITSSSHVDYTGLDWEIEASGDYNADGRSDILWRNTVTGHNWMYLMDGAAILTNIMVNQVYDQNWQIQ